MTPRPISLREPQLPRLLAGTLTALRRPWTGLTRSLAPGQLLWVREPFVLDRKWDGLSPTSAAGLGAQPQFVWSTDRPDPAILAAGRPRMARELLRAWHRQHLVLVSIERQRLQAISEQEIRAEGFVSRAGFIAAWDRNLSLAKADEHCWNADPTVAVLHFIRVATPLPELQA